MGIVFLGIITFIASFLGTISGFGISTIMVPLVLFFLPLPETLLLVGLIHWFGDIWKIILFKHAANWRVILLFGIPGIVASALGAYLLLTISEVVVSRFIGGILVAYSVFLFAKPKFEIQPSPVVSIAGGVSSGFLGGISGVGGGALRAIVLSAFNLPKEVYIFTSGAIGFAIDASRITTYFLGGIKIQNNLLVGLILFIPLSFVAARLAKTLIGQINQKSFRMIIGIFLLGVGIKLFFFP